MYLGFNSSQLVDFSYQILHITNKHNMSNTNLGKGTVVLGWGTFQSVKYPLKNE